MKLAIVSLTFGTLLLGATPTLAAHVSVSIGVPFLAVAPPPVVYQPEPAPYYVAPPVVYVGGDQWGGDHNRGHDHDRGRQPQSRRDDGKRR
ncbi:MAG: hypothetical protein ABSF50_12105 [Burkholderiaceae bacterium]